MRILDLMLPSSKVLGRSFCIVFLGFSVLAIQEEAFVDDQLGQLSGVSESEPIKVVSPEDSSKDQQLNDLGLIPLLPTSSDKNLWSENLNLYQAQSAINQLATQALGEQSQANPLDQLSQPQSLEAQDQQIQAIANNAVSNPQSEQQSSSAHSQVTQANQAVNYGAIGGTVGGIGGLFAAGGLVKGLSSTTGPDYSKEHQMHQLQDTPTYGYDQGPRPRAASVDSGLESLDGSGPTFRHKPNHQPSFQRPTRRLPR